jgi:hypothetical protein
MDESPETDRRLWWQAPVAVLAGRFATLSFPTATAK